MSVNSPTQGPSRRETAEFFKLGLRLGLFDTLPVIRWADAIIAQEEKPHISIIDVSLAGSQGINQTIASLGEVTGELREGVPAKLFLAYCWRRLTSGRESIDSVAALLYKLKNLPEVIGEMETELYILDESLSLAEDGVYGSVEDALAGIERFLGEHCEYAAYLPREV